MNVNDIVIVPGAGWASDDASYFRGPTLPLYSEVDLVDLVTPRLSDELNFLSLRAQTLNTRIKPGIKESERINYIQTSTLGIFLNMGFSKKPLKKNQTRITYGSDESKALAEELADIVSEWGRCCTFGHVRCAPVKDKSLDKGGTLAVRIEPFYLNGPNIDDYLRRISFLGKDIATGVYLYLNARQNLTYKALSVPEKPKKQPNEVYQKVFA